VVTIKEMGRRFRGIIFLPDNLPATEKSILLIQRTQRWIMILAILLVVIPVLSGWVFNRFIVQVDSVTIENTHVIGDSVICPGEILFYEYEIEALGAGDLMKNHTIWQIDPPLTLIFSTPRYFILPEAVHQYVRDSWPVPSGFYSYREGKVIPLGPGTFKLLFSVSSPTRSTIHDQGEVMFSIPENC
jgi:hypothetical protein